jgi:hypothetical protein
MTTEQAIILGFFAAAFLAGWIAHAVVGRARRPRKAIGPVDEGPVAPLPAQGLEHPAHGDRDDLASSPPRYEQAVHGSRDELARATRAYHAAVVGSLEGDGRAPDRTALEALAGSLLALARSVDHASQELDAQHPLKSKLHRMGDDLRRLADDVTRHSREREIPTPVFDRLEQHLIAAASMILGSDRPAPLAV